MKTFNYFLVVLTMVVAYVVFLLMWGRNHGYEPFVLGAILVTFKTYILFFNGAAIIFALPLLAGKRNAVAFYNMTAGKDFLWGMISGACYVYLLIWVLYALMPLDLISGLNLFNHSYDHVTDMLTYNLPIFGEYIINDYQFGMMYLIILFGILGVKASYLAIRWSETLSERELTITPSGHIY